MLIQVTTKDVTTVMSSKSCQNWHFKNLGWITKTIQSKNFIFHSGNNLNKTVT
jgi:hypothetical protein